MNNKQYLISLGWTPQACRERMAGCWQGIKEIQDNKNAWTYRFLYRSLYLKYKNYLRILNS